MVTILIGSLIYFFVKWASQHFGAIENKKGQLIQAMRDFDFILQTTFIIL